MKDSKYKRLVQTSVTAFVHCGDDYLFLKRALTKSVDPGKLNGVGGRVEPGEDFLACCIREVKEETGYIVTPEDIQLAGVVRLEGGFEEDWIMNFFTVNVDSKDIPRGKTTEDGELLWIDKNSVLDTKYDLLDDLNYCFEHIIDGKRIFFMTAIVNTDEKVEKISISFLDKPS